MDRSVIQTAHTVSIVDMPVVPFRSGWGSMNLSIIKTKVPHRKSTQEDFDAKVRSVYKWSIFIFPLVSFLHQSLTIMIHVSRVGSVPTRISLAGDVIRF